MPLLSMRRYFSSVSRSGSAATSASLMKRYVAGPVVGDDNRRSARFAFGIQGFENFGFIFCVCPAF